MFEKKKVKNIYVTEAGAKELKNNGSLVVMAFVQRANSLEPECKTHIGLENLARSLIPNGNLITESDKEVDSTCPQNAGEKKDLSRVTLAYGSDRTDLSVQPPMDLP